MPTLGFMSSPALQPDARYTWADYRTWPDDERWEIIGGHAYAMAASPTSRHQRIVTELAILMGPFFRGDPCRLFLSPMDVKLSDEDIVQPDLLVVCDPKQIARTHIEGPPHLVVEVASESSHIHDRQAKSALYARFGIAEYWIVTPFPSLVEIFTLRDGAYVWAKSFAREETLASPSFPDLSLPLAPVFDFPLDDHEKELYRVKERPARYTTIGPGQGAAGAR